MNSINCKCLSVQQQYEFEAPPGLIYPQAILFDDINDDGRNELIIGTSNGEIHVYKGLGTQAWIKNTKVGGPITCLASDNVLNVTKQKQKYLTVLDAVGYIYILNLVQANSSEEMKINKAFNVRKRYQSDLPTGKAPIEMKYELKVCLQRKLLPNPKYCLVIDACDNSGLKELVVAYSDRKIHLYRWDSPNILFNFNQITNNNPSLDVGKFILQQSWELEYQINSISLSKDYVLCTHTKTLFVSQPCGRIFLCQLNNTSNNKSTSIVKTTSSASKMNELTTNTHHQPSTPQQGQSNSSQRRLTNQTATQQPININQSQQLNQSQITTTPSTTESGMSNSNKKTDQEKLKYGIDMSQHLTNQDSTIPSYIITNVACQRENTQYAFVVTFNGDIFFINLGQLVYNYSKIWHRSINNIVLNCFKADKDNYDELIIVTPDGLVYIINHLGDIVSFDIGEPIHLSYMGYYSTEQTNLHLILDPSIDYSESTFTTTTSTISTTAFEMALDGPINISLSNESAQYKDGVNKPYLVFLSSITNKLFLIQLDSFKTSKIKFENVFTNNRSLPTNSTKTLDKREVMKSLKNLLYKGHDNDEDFVDDANCNQIR